MCHRIAIADLRFPSSLEEPGLTLSQNRLNAGWSTMEYASAQLTINSVSRSFAFGASSLVILETVKFLIPI
jgi:hypothetical protein